MVVFAQINRRLRRNAFGKDGATGLNMCFFLDSSQDIHPALNDDGVRSAVAKISAPSVIDRLRSGSRGLLLVQECRGMKNPFAKKAVVTNKRQQTCCRPPPVCDSRQLNSQLKMSFLYRFVFLDASLLMTSWSVFATVA